MLQRAKNVIQTGVSVAWMPQPSLQGRIYDVSEFGYILCSITEYSQAFIFFNCNAVSNIRFAKPHSLSNQIISFTNEPSLTRV